VRPTPAPTRKTEAPATFDKAAPAGDSSRRRQLCALGSEGHARSTESSGTPDRRWLSRGCSHPFRHTREVGTALSSASAESFYRTIARPDAVQRSDPSGATVVIAGSRLNDEPTGIITTLARNRRSAAVRSRIGSGKVCPQSLPSPHCFSAVVAPTGDRALTGDCDRDM